MPLGFLCPGLPSLDPYTSGFLLPELPEPWAPCALDPYTLGFLRPRLPEPWAPFTLDPYTLRSLYTGSLKLIERKVYYCVMHEIYSFERVRKEAALLF